MGAGNRNLVKSISHPGLFLKKKGGARAKIYNFHFRQLTKLRP